MGILARGWIAVLLILLPNISAQAADTVASFYAGKTLRVISPFEVSGVYGQVAKLLADYLPKYLPGHPTGVPQFMVGAGGLQGTNYMANGAPRDGTVISVLYDSMPATQVTDPTEVRFDARLFNVLGSINKGDFGLAVVMKTSGVTNIEDAKTHALYFGATGTGSAQYYVPDAMNKLLGTKFKLIPGYPSVAEQFLAMDKGEAQGIFTNYSVLLGARPEWFSNGTLNFLAQLGDQRSYLFPDVPLLQDLAKNPSDKEVFSFLAQSRVPGKIFFAPPGVPADRLDALRQAFAAALKDPELRNLILKLQLEYDPRDWQTAQNVITRTVETPPEILTRVKQLINSGN